MALMTVYHGSGDVVAAPEIRVGRYTKDFGPGFYCTVIREQAERWAQRMPVADSTSSREGRTPTHSSP